MAGELRAPFLRLSIAMVLVLLSALGTLALRQAQPLLELRLVAGPDGLPRLGGAEGPGALALAGPDGMPELALHPDLLVEDPDMLGSYAAMRRFLDNQRRIDGLLQAALAQEAPLRLRLDDGTTRPVPVHPRSPLAQLPLAFWVQWLVGAVVLAIAGFFHVLRPGAGRRGAPPEGVAGFVLAGVGVSAAAFSAAIYSTRSLAIAPELLPRLSLLNHTGTFAFGIGMIWLFARYPRPILHPRWVAGMAALAAMQQLAYRLQALPHPLAQAQTMVAAMFLAILALVLAQYRATRGHPADRAALLWLGLSVLLGSGVFVLLVALPAALGQDAVLSQGMAFIPLCAIYVGTALALARYRLFDLDRWAWRLFFHLAIIALIVLADATLLLTLSLSGPASLASAVALVGLVYFPLRDLVFDRWMGRKRPDPATLYQETVSVALQFGQPARAAAWSRLLERLFAPLTMEPLPAPPAAARLEAEGLTLAVPGPQGVPGLALGHAEGGRRLFNAGDAALVAQLAALVEAADRDRAAYETAVTRERQRIARDLHDDVGARLLSSLHARDETSRQDFLIEALSDLRQIAAGLAGREVTLAILIGEMRAESRSRAEALGRSLVWPLGSADDAAEVLDYPQQRNLTAIQREALSNALAHGDGPVTMRAEVEAGRLRLTVENALAAPAAARSTAALRGNGLRNMRARAEALGGTLRSGADPAGGRYRLELVLPLKAGTADKAVA